MQIEPFRVRTGLKCARGCQAPVAPVQQRPKQSVDRTPSSPNWTHVRERLLGASGACSATTGAKRRSNPFESELDSKKIRSRTFVLLLIFYVRERIRTPDTLVRSQVLYPAELRTHIQLALSCNAGDRNRTGTVSLHQDFKSCASASSATPAYGTYRARTCDPLLVRQMLSQLS